MVAQIDRTYVRSRPTKVVSRLISYALFEGRPLTTRGRWINPLVFAHFGLEKRLPALARVDRPIFVIGTGRSGTTILGVLMSMHRDVGFLNEPKALWHSIFPNEDVIGSYTRGPVKYRLNSHDVTPAVRRNAHRLFGAYLRTVCSKRLVDKYPELVFRVPFVREIFPNAKFLFLVRNGWDTCASIDKWSQRLGVQEADEVHDWWGADNRKWQLMMDELVVAHPMFAGIAEDIRALTDHGNMAAVEWIVTMQEGLSRMRANPDCVHMIRYEDVVDRPDEELGKMLAFCELDVDAVFMDYARTTLRPAPMHKPFSLDPVIAPLFEQTMRDLGYV